MEFSRRHAEFTWEKQCRLPGIPDLLPPPEFYLQVLPSSNEPTLCEVYFGNNSGMALERVSSRSGGSLTVDDSEVLSFSNRESPVYETVLPDEAVLIGHYDAIYDSDFIVQWNLYVSSDNAERCYTATAKGMAHQMRLELCSG